MGNKLPHKSYIITSFITAVLAAGSTYYVASSDTYYRIIEEVPNAVVYQYQTENAVVASVIDGDTLTLSDGRSVRLTGINTPELGACYGAQAQQELERLVLGKTIRLEKDVRTTDSFGRYLRYVYLDQDNPDLDNLFVNHHLVKQGFAFDQPIGLDTRYRGHFVSARESARSAGRGLWLSCPELVSKNTSTKNTVSVHTEPTNPNCTIKGNISTDGLGKTYIPRGCSIYANTKINPHIGEQYFCTAEEAVDAGFVLNGSCK